MAEATDRLTRTYQRAQVDDSYQQPITRVPSYSSGIISSVCDSGIIAIAAGHSRVRVADPPNPALGENGTPSPLAISSHVKTQTPAEFCVMSAAQTSLVSGDPPIMNSLGSREYWGNIWVSY